MEDIKENQSNRIEEDSNATISGIKRFSFSYVLIGFLAIFLMLLQIIFASSIQEFDGIFIESLQKLLPISAYTSNAFKYICDIFYYYTEFYVFNGFICFLYCTVSPLISFKIGLVFNLAIYMHTIMIVLMYREPRPFWTMSGIHTTNCQASFVGPSYSQFVVTLMMIYFSFILKQYNIVKSPIMFSIILGISIFINLITFLFNILNGVYFVYQNFLGIIIGVMIGLIAIIGDNSITILSLKLAFFHKSSKKYKFLFLIFLAMTFSLCMAFTTILETKTLVLAKWVQYYNVFWHIY